MVVIQQGLLRDKRERYGKRWIRGVEIGEEEEAAMCEQLKVMIDFFNSLCV